MTPAAQLESQGSHSRPPTTTSDPRGSFTIAERNSSYALRNRASRSVSDPLPRSGPPATTSRVGSPPVWESTTRTLRTSRPVLDTTLSRWLDSTSDKVGDADKKCNDAKDLLLESCSGGTSESSALCARPYYVYNIQQSRRIYNSTRKPESRLPPFRAAKPDLPKAQSGPEFRRGLGLFDSTMLVVGVM